jgi:hypothetical protein
MPQIDKVTFYAISIWTFIVYFVGYVVINMYFFIYLFNKLKLEYKFILLGIEETRLNWIEFREIAKLKLIRIRQK